MHRIIITKQDVGIRRRTLARQGKTVMLEPEECVPKTDAGGHKLSQPAERAVAVGPIADGLGQLHVDVYLSKLVKLIPAEAIAAYLTLEGIIRSAANPWLKPILLTIALVIGLIGTPLYLRKFYCIDKRKQLVLSTLAFGVWVFAIGGVFAVMSWYEPYFGSIVLVAFTFFVPLVGDYGQSEMLLRRAQAIS